MSTKQPLSDTGIYKSSAPLELGDEFLLVKAKDSRFLLPVTI